MPPQVETVGLPAVVPEGTVRTGCQCDVRHGGGALPTVRKAVRHPIHDRPEWAEF